MMSWIIGILIYIVLSGALYVLFAANVRCSDWVHKRVIVMLLFIIIVYPWYVCLRIDDKIRHLLEDRRSDRIRRKWKKEH